MTEREKHDRQFHGDPARLRAPDRLARLEPERVVAQSLEGAAVSTALDVGTGTGVFAQAFADAGVRVVGVDLRADVLRLAQGHAPEADFALAAAEALPFTDGSFDLVFLAHVLHETDEPLLALSEAARTARTRIVVLEWPYREEASGPPLEHRLRRERIETLARSAGLAPAGRVELSHMDLYRFATR